MNGLIPLPPVRRERLPNGLQLVVAERPGIPLVACRLVIRGGSALDPDGRAGLALANTLGSLAAGLVAVYLGVAAGRAI